MADQTKPDSIPPDLPGEESVSSQNIIGQTLILSITVDLNLTPKTFIKHFIYGILKISRYFDF